MKLLKFRVTNFRSVDDSGWILTDDVTALIGTNESGKTNLIVPLWKLHPAKDGEINLIADAPRRRYNEIKNMEEKPVFIEAHFALSDALVQQLATLTEIAPDMLHTVAVKRDLAGAYDVDFPAFQATHTIVARDIIAMLQATAQDIESMSIAAKAEEPIKQSMLTQLVAATDTISTCELLDKDMLTEVADLLRDVNKDHAARRSTIVPRYEQACDVVEAALTQLSIPHPRDNQAAVDLILESLPSFVYYSNYGNLDSEIYLPHVIENMSRTDLGSREEAKVRTLKVLFEFVNLEPQEILELGRDFPQGQGRPTDAQIKAVAEKKKEREILLQSASSSLTERFKDWWKQGDYRLRFQADGAHFRIWVSDDKRPDEIELEGRSTGLQWFLSFYLIFLVESLRAHRDSILLLDEPGLSLHPLSQKDLSLFFENLSRQNQLIYTTHSPFMVDPNHLDRVRSVYIDGRGMTVASSNLRAAETNPAQSRSIYAVHAALGLAVSDAMIQGCQPIIVEGFSDQLYLNAIKNYLIREGKINPQRELIFVPSGGVRGITATVAILTAKDEALPYVILDSDRPGLDTANKLKTGTYQGSTDRILTMGDICEIASAEVEDLFPPRFFANIVTRYLRGPEVDFHEVLTAGAIIPQIEAYAKTHHAPLPDGWKVELARLVKARVLRVQDETLKTEPIYVARWVDLFQKLDA